MYNIKITNDTINKKLYAVNDNNDIMEIILSDSVILYNKIKQDIHSYSNNIDILYLAISLRKYIRGLKPLQLYKLNQFVLFKIQNIDLKITHP